MPSIVQVNVSQQVAPTPSRLQRSGAALSQGGTNTAKGTLTLLTQLSDLSPVINGSKAITSITQTTGTATATTTAAHGFTISDTLYLTIVGALPAAYNGTFLCTITGTSTFTYAVPSGTTSPSTGTKSYTVEDVAELNQMVTTFFAQGTGLAMYVLECGPGNATDGANFLTFWLLLNPGIIYSFLTPRYWDANAAFLALIASYESPTSRLYFWVTTTLATYQNYTALMKNVNALIESPAFGAWSANVLTAISSTGGTVTATTTTAHGVLPGQWFSISGCTPAGYNGTWLALTGTTGSTLVYSVPADPGAQSVLGTLVASYYANAGVGANEFSQAAPFRNSLFYDPSSTNKVGPLEWQDVFGVTQYPTRGQNAVLTTLKAANISVIGSGAEGGISDTIIMWGNMLDGNPFNYWYAIDYAAIQLDLFISAFIINGSNNPQNPLYLDQPGVTRTQGAAARVFSNMITFGMALGSAGTVLQTKLTSADWNAALDRGDYDGLCVVNSVPFPDYYNASPGDYKIGKYGGYSATFVPLRGFDNIVFNLAAISFPAG